MLDIGSIRNANVATKNVSSRGAGKPALPAAATASERKKILEQTAVVLPNVEQSTALAHWITYDLANFRQSIRGRQRMRSPAEQRDALDRIALACKTAAHEINKQLQAVPNSFDAVTTGGIFLDRDGDIAGGFEGLVAQLRAIAEKSSDWAAHAMELRSENLHNQHSAVFVMATRWAQITRTDPATNREFSKLATALLGLFEGPDGRQNRSQSVAQGLKYWASCGRREGEFDIFVAGTKGPEK